MAFCTKCGKEIPEGGVCSCQQDGASQTQTGASQKAAGAKGTPEVIKDVIDLFKGIKTPADAVGKYVDNAKVLSAVVLIAVCAVINAITNVLYVVGANLETAKAASKVYSTVFGSTYGIASMGQSIALIVGKCILGFFLGLVTPFAVAAITALLFTVIIKAFDKASTITFQKSMVVASLSLAVAVPCELVGSIVAIIPFSFFNTVGGWFTSFGSAAGVVLTVIGLRKIVKDDNHLVAVYALATVAAAVVLSILKLPVGI